jgi:protein-S-isoprenylcysteine O-methyltransferase Ste14
MIGWALGFRSAVGLVIAALIFVVLLARIRSEERLLLSQFGDQYAAYRARTWRLFPGLF